MPLGQKRTEAFDVMIDDGHGGAVIKTVVVTVTGTNDAPVVAAADLDGAVTEISGKPVKHTVLTDAGTIAFSDVDLADTHTVSVAKVGSTLGRIKASIAADTADGTGGSVAWTYKVGASKLEYLAQGEQRIETFNVTVKDRHGGASTQTVTVVLTGTNDAPTLASVDLRGAVTETLGASAPGAQLSDHGTVAFTDVDLADTHTVSVAGFNAGASGTTTSALGTLTATLVADTVNGTGGVLSWTYTVDAAAVEYLGKGQKRTEAFDVVVSDGHGGTTTKTVVVTITGTADTPTANHAPVVSGAVAGTAVEDSALSTLDALDNASDVDANTTLSVVNLPASLPPGVSYDAATHSFTLDPSNAAFQLLGPGATTIVTVNYGVSDGLAATPASVSWTVTGTNDAAVLSSATVNLGETDAAADHGRHADHQRRRQRRAPSWRRPPPPAPTARSQSTQPAPGPTRRTRRTTSSWPASPTPTPSRWRAPTAPQPRSPSTSSAPTTPRSLSSGLGNLTESNTPAAISTSGTLTISDVDSAATFVAQAGTVGSYGTFAIDAAGAWTYTANSAHDEFVAGITYTDTFAVASADGTTTSVTVNILGTNDAAVVSADTRESDRDQHRGRYQHQRHR